MSELHKNAFWAYGVVVALAIREPLLSVLPHLIKNGFRHWEVQLEVWRLFVFLILIVRFYLGSGLYFHENYILKTDGKKSYPIDFLSGLFHFLAFLAGGVVLSTHARIAGEVPYFLCTLAVVLLYDNVWWAAAWVSGFDTIEQIRDWAQFNNTTCIASVVAYLVCRVFGHDPVFSEHVAMFPVLLASTYEIKYLISRYEEIAPAAVSPAGHGDEVNPAGAELELPALPPTKGLVQGAPSKSPKKRSR